MAKKPAIPVLNSQDRTIYQVVAAMKVNIEVITGARAGSAQIETLGTTATTAQIVSKINEIIGRLNYDGN
jgi:hypothetical protein